MTVLIVVSICALAVLVVVQGFVLLEMVRQTSQIRKVLDLDDRPTPVSLGELAGQPLPEPARAVWSENGASRDGVLVLLSTDCSTCRLVASGLRDLVDRFDQQRIVGLLQARDDEDASELLAATGLGPEELVVDVESAYASGIPVALRPAAVVVRKGIVSEGAIVRNPHQLQQLLEALESSRLEAVQHMSETEEVSTLTTGGVR
jgi:hypothetical protein